MIKKQTETNRQSKAVNKIRNSLGFTMAELLIVVAIIGVLSAVSFVAVQTHQKNLSQAELDAIAKQIYIAAQNHLIMAENENYLGSTAYGTPVDTENGIYCFTNDDFSPNNNLLDQMLPFGALDETVRSGGYYIIYYQPESATVLDVFYTKDPFSFPDTTRADYGGDGKKNERRDHGPMMGWYGGFGSASEIDAADGIADIATGQWLEEPTIVVENAEKLRVIVNDPNGTVGETGFTFKLIVSGLDLNGKETGAKAAITLRNGGTSVTGARTTLPTNSGDPYVVVLDDVTASGLHFADLTAQTLGYSFLPGQNISIQAVAYNEQKRSNIASSNVEITNSLFERIDREGDAVTASINNIRHLENLEEEISGLQPDTFLGAGIERFTPKKAIQTSDMSWKAFKTNIGSETASIVPRGGSATPTNAGCYMPVSPGYALDYDGRNYNISDIKANYAGNAGLFGTLADGSRVSNLALIDFDIAASSGHAGALAGAITGTNVSNVLAYDKNTPATATNVTAASGSAGGLIGEMSSGAVSKCAAALIVNGKDAGGLIGKADGGTVTASYSGGHTDKAEYYNHDDDGKRTAEIYNVTGTDSAGGLIGTGTGMGDIQYCYSTCSAKGKSAGGFAGKLALASGKKVADCYATGLVKGTEADGAFARSLTGTAVNCKYFEIINERQETDGGFSYLTALGEGQSNDGITAIDETTATYNAFSWSSGAECPWKNAMVYDKKLIEYYGSTDETVRNARYSLRTVGQLGATIQEVPTTTEGVTTPADFVATHYGDWPAPEIFVFNAKKTT